jgi:RNA polymerase sigma-70 factor (ECF subfamily)
MPEAAPPCYRGARVSVLADIYKGAAGEAAHAGVSPVDLEARLVTLCARGRAAHPSLGVADDVFVTHLARCEAPVLDVFATVHAEDLYLVCACLEGNAAALAALRTELRPVLARHLARIRGAKAIFDEVEQQLWNRALVGGGEGPKLARYTGRGALGSWVGVSGQRIALMILRHERVEARARQEAAAERSLVRDDPELGAIKERYREQFQEAVEAAIAALDARDRTLYRMSLVDGLSVVQIAKAYGVHHTTVVRWLAAARERIAEEAKRHLRAALSVSSGEFDSIARMLLSQLDLDVSAVLSAQR